LLSRNVEIVNPLGLHARAAAKFVHIATKFKSQININKDGIVVDGKSILGILMLAAACGTIIEISADGEDEKAAVKTLVELVHRGFEE
jgi:phosphocarrier protein HPr